MAEVGKNIRKIRKEKNLTQDDLAQRLHCTRQTISNYENGKSEPSIELLLEIAGVFGVEVNDLIYGQRKSADIEKGKIAAVIIPAVVLQAAVVFLTPLAREYGREQFVLEPMYLLRYVLRPLAMAFLGWAVGEAGRELPGIHLWEKKSEKTRRIVHIVFCILAICLAVAAVLTLWLGVEMGYQWYLTEKMMREQGEYVSWAVPHLMPSRLASGIIYFYMLCLDRIGIFGGTWFFLGAALAFCRIGKKEKSE